MTPGEWGLVLGCVAGLGLVLVVEHVLARRRGALASRVMPYLRDLPTRGAPSGAAALDGPTSWRDLAVTGRRAVAEWVGGVLGGAASVERRLTRSGSGLTLLEFRISQVSWGLAAFAVAAVPSGWIALHSPGRTVPLLILCACCFVAGVLLRENRLTADVRARERRILAEFPTVAQLLALAVAAGEGPAAALDRVVRRSHGELSAELGVVLAEARTGVPLAEACDRLAARTGIPAVSRFAEGLAVALERGTPLADVLHAQAGDVREAGRRALIESGARREVLMMVPVVFLVLPTVVVFAFWPGLVGLRLVVP